jgi:hypothetical protein
MTESILITAKINAKQKRDVMTANIPNAFVQTDIEDKNHIKGQQIIMKIRGPLVNMLVDVEPKVYEDFVAYEGKDKVLYVKMLKAIYGMLQSSLHYYKKFQKDIESIGFEVYPSDPCIANQIIKAKQHIVSWHDNDLKSSHVDSTANDEFLNGYKKSMHPMRLAKLKLSEDTAMII